MLRSNQSVFAVAGVIFAGTLITAMSPSTVHAVVETAATAVKATLVQVTNTASSPVVTQSIGQQAAQAVHLTCNSTGLTCALFSVSGGSSESYVVPAGQSLVVTAVDIMPTQIYLSPTCSVEHQDGLYLTTSTGSAYSQLWIVNSVSVHYSYPSGMVFPSGSSITTASGYFGTPSPSCYGPDDYNDRFDIYGYLTAS